MSEKIEKIRARHRAVMQEKSHKRYEDRNGAEAHHDRAFLLLELDRVSAENERLRDVLRRVSVHTSGDGVVKITFVKEDCMVTYPVCPQTTWALEVMIEFDKVHRNALEDKP